MNRIDSTFADLRAKGRAALVAFLTAGDPDMATTGRLMLAAAASGADLLEIGVPFSDPTADGPVLQRSLEIGLRNGASLGRVLELTAEFRQVSQVPVVLYGYYNPIFHYGPERFAAAARQAGVDGVLVVDLPPEEAAELSGWLKAAGIHMILLLAPTSGPDRVQAVVRQAGGFIYYVAVTGVTGVKPMRIETVRPAIAELRRATTLPVGIGFGITTPEQAAEVAESADAAVVGSALMRLVDEHRGTDRVVPEVAAFIGRLKEAMDRRRAGLHG